jgi:hypothetical protein
MNRKSQMAALGMMAGAVLAGLPAAAIDLGSLADGLKQAGRAGQAAHAVADAGGQQAQLEGEMVLTTAPAASFSEARAHAVQEVSDGQPVYLHLRLPKPLSNYVYSYRDIAKNAFRIEIGPADKLRESHGSTLLNLTDEELRATELHLPLAPAVPRGKLYDSVWTSVVGGGRPGVWHNEIRILSYADTTRLDAPTYLAIAPLTASVTEGIDKYRAMTADFLNHRVAGDPATNQAPAKVARSEPALAATVLKQAAQARGSKPDAFYFTDDGWYDHRNGLGQLEYQRTMAAILYKEGGKCFAHTLDISRWPNGRVETSLDKHRIELSCNRYAQTLASVR